MIHVGIKSLLQKQSHSDGELRLDPRERCFEEEMDVSLRLAFNHSYSLFILHVLYLPIFDWLENSFVFLEDAVTDLITEDKSLSFLIL
jgi:hypothetical protein